VQVTVEIFVAAKNRKKNQVISVGTL